MSEMKDMDTINNDVNGSGSHGAESTSSGRCPTVEQRGPGRHPATARTGWTKEMNIAVMECYFLSNLLMKMKSQLGVTEDECIVFGMNDKVCI